MLEYIDKILNQFRPCFSRLAAFKWFSIIVIGLMTRPDLLGTTSVIRALALNPGCYEAMNLFFRASSWTLDNLKRKWFEIIASSGLLYQEHGYTILIGDGVKQSKEGKSLLLLDRYFLSVPALRRLSEHMKSEAVTLHLVTKAKKSCVAYEPPAGKKPGRGRPPKKGKSIKLKELFYDKSNEFEETVLLLYGRNEPVRYYCINLLWGQKLYQELRFVLVEYKGVQSILVSTDLSLEPTAVIRLYSYRFKIECTFRELKQVLGAFRYHFWSKAIPKLKRYQKKGEQSVLETVVDPKKQKRIQQAVKATEGYMMLSCIAMGMVQMISLSYSKEIQAGALRYMRTPSKTIVSEATVVDYLRRNIFRVMAETPELNITRIIQEKQKQPDITETLRAS